MSSRGTPVRLAGPGGRASRCGARGSAVAVVLALALPAALGAQTGVPVSGTVYDSIRGGPLAGAVVEALGTNVRTRTDEDGHYTFVLPAGEHQLDFTHPDVAAWPAMRTAPVVQVGTTPVTASMGTVSQRTVLARTCGGSGSVVGGVVRDMLTRVPVARAQVQITGRVDGGRTELGRIATDLDGSFQLCVGALPSEGVDLRASIGGHDSRVVSLPTDAGYVVAADLNVLVSQPARISGVLLDGTSRAPVPDAMVRVDGTRLGARSGPSGHFLIRGVPPGAVSLSVEHIRYGRRTTEVLAESGDSVHVEFELLDEAIPLEEMVVRVSRASTERRDRMGTRFDGLDRAQIEELLPRSSDLDDLLRNANIPGLDVTSDGRSVCVELSRRTGAFLNSCQMADVYLNDVRVSNAREFLTQLQPETIERIQVVSPVEAVGRYGGAAVRFGVLLIYTIGN